MSTNTEGRLFAHLRKWKNIFRLLSYSHWI
jgi:hypothetical protein